MGFNLDRPAREFHHEIPKETLYIDGEDSPIMAVFRTCATNAELDDMIVGLRSLEGEFRENLGERINERMQEKAKEFFVGWANPPGREELWVCSGGKPVDPTPELVANFLAIPVVAPVLCAEFLSAVTSRRPQLGNSKPSRGNGFGSLVKAAETPKP